MICDHVNDLRPSSLINIIHDLRSLFSGLFILTIHTILTRNHFLLKYDSSDFCDWTVQCLLKQEMEAKTDIACHSLLQYHFVRTIRYILFDLQLQANCLLGTLIHTSSDTNHDVSFCASIKCCKIIEHF